MEEEGEATLGKELQVTGWTPSTCQQEKQFLLRCLAVKLKKKRKEKKSEFANRYTHCSSAAQSAQQVFPVKTSGVAKPTRTEILTTGYRKRTMTSSGE